MANVFAFCENAVRTQIKKCPLLRGAVFCFWGAWNLLRRDRLFASIRHADAAAGKGKKVVIFALRTIATTNLVYVDALFGHAFKKLGCDVRMLYCDGLLDSCDTDSVNYKQNLQCFLCKTFNRPVKRLLRLPCLSFRGFISAVDIRRIEKTVAGLPDNQLLDFIYLGVDVGKYAKSSAIRYFLEAIIDMGDPATVAVVRRKLVNAMIVTTVASELYRRQKPDLVFMLHGIYSTWGPFYKFFTNQHVDLIVFNNRDERFGHSIFNRNGCQFDLFAPQRWESFSKQPFQESHKQEIEEFLRGRFNGLLYDSLTLYEKYYNKTINKHSQLASLYNEKYTRRYVLFSNVFWDAVVEDMGSDLFPDIVEWINRTVAHFASRPDLQLIIKPHPGEMGGATGERTMKGVAEYIADACPKLPENIQILPADTPLRAYDLISANMVGLTFNGTIGLELATQGVPVIVAANCHYKETGVVYAIKSVEEYFDLIDDPRRLVEFARGHIEFARKYAYYYFFKTMVRLPIYRDTQWSTMDWKAVADTDTLFAPESGLMKIFRRIVDGEDVLAPL